MQKVDLLQFMFMGNLDKNLELLEEMCLEEEWNSYNRNDRNILRNYLFYTFYRLCDEDKVIETNEYCVFNLGLLNKFYEELYVYAIPNDEGYGNIRWKFVAFSTDYELTRCGVKALPERADYFFEPELLVYDWHYPINVQYRHILTDENNRMRLPEKILKMPTSLALQIIKGSIDIAIKKVMANYRIAVPQYFNGKIQLLIPLSFDTNEPELVLVVTKDEQAKCYQGHTCITTDMAYMNARLISRSVDSNWLKP